MDAKKNNQRNAINVEKEIEIIIIIMFTQIWNMNRITIERLQVWLQV